TGDGQTKVADERFMAIPFFRNRAERGGELPQGAPWVIEALGPSPRDRPCLQRRDGLLACGIRRENGPVRDCCPLVVCERARMQSRKLEHDGRALERLVRSLGAELQPSSQRIQHSEVEQERIEHLTLFPIELGGQPLIERSSERSGRLSCKRRV